MARDYNSETGRDGSLTVRATASACCGTRILRVRHGRDARATIQWIGILYPRVDQNEQLYSFIEVFACSAACLHAAAATPLVIGFSASLRQLSRHCLIMFWYWAR